MDYEVHSGNGKQNGNSKRSSNGSRISEREMVAGTTGTMKPKPVSCQSLTIKNYPAKLPSMQRVNSLHAG